MLAHDVGPQAQRLVASQAVAAGAAEGVGEDDGLLAGLQAAVGIGLDDHAGGFDAHRLRQAVRDADAVVAHVQVDPVQAGGVNAQQHLAGAARRDRDVAQEEAGAATGFENGCFHRRASPQVYAAERREVGTSTYRNVVYGAAQYQ